MIKPKIFYKSMLVASAIILAYTLVLLLVVLPLVEESTQSLEEKNGKEILNKVVLLTKNMQTNLEDFQIKALQYHKKELKTLTDTFWSIVQEKYKQSRPENIGSLLQNKGEEFRNNLTLFYNKNKKSMSTEELQQAIIHYINIYRYSKGSGYFFIHKQTTVVEHPIYPEFKGKDFAHLKDENGIHFVREFHRICQEKGSGTLRYQWKHAKTGAMEEKVAFVFTFEPFDWIIGTSGSLKELQEMLKDEVITLANTIRYDTDNYFFIYGYDYKVIAHPYIAKGTDFSEVRDSHGNLIVPPMIKVAREQGEGFTRYWWKKDPEREETFEKLTFSRDFPDWQMVIHTGTYIDDIQHEIDTKKAELIEQLAHIVRKTTVGKTGYLFIVDGDSNMVIHRNAYIVGKYTRGMKNPVSGNSIFEDLTDAAKSGNSLYYKWDRPTDKGNFIYDKILWVVYIPELQWFVASSVYANDLKETSQQLKKVILFLGCTIFLLSFLISLIFFRRLLKPITTLSRLASRVTGGDYSVRSHLQSNDEIGALANEFNTMVDTIEDNIHSLDKNVAEKTKEIEEQNMLFETLFYESSDGFLLIRDGLFVDCNRAAYQMLRYDGKNELMTLHPSKISPPLQADGRNSQEKADEVMAHAMEKGSSRFEWTHLCKDGSETLFEVVLTRVVLKDDFYIHVVWRDINEKKAAEQQLQKTVREFSAVMDAIDYGVLFMDNQLQARVVNQAFRDIWGVSTDFVNEHPTMRELMEYNRDNNLYPVEDSDFDHYMDERESAVRQGTISPGILEQRDGTILQYQCVVLPDGWRMLTYFDITELKNTQDQLARAQKMEAIGMMAGGVAHDLNNILSGIVSYPELILLQLPEESKLRKPIEAIRDSGKRAATVVADLLTVARGVASTREPHDINVLIQEYLQSPECEKLESLHPDVVCTKYLQAAQSIISCSPMHIKKTVMNLLTNAMEAVGLSGEITISTANLENDGRGREEGNSLPVGHYVVLTVQDNGPGINEDNIRHIFEPFYSKKVMGRSGTGLGLTVVWNTVEDHGGEIRVQSSEKGTLFTLYFPLSTESVNHHKENGEEKQLYNGAEEHILVVDDEQQLRDIASEILTTLGYTVTSVASGEEAIEFVRENPVDLLVVDMLMEPGINGRQTYGAILQLYPEQRAIVASGFSESDDVKATLKLGAHGFIKKPYSIEQLGSAVKEALMS